MIDKTRKQPYYRISKATHATLLGWYSNKGTTGESILPYIMNPISCRFRRKYRQFQASWAMRLTPKTHLRHVQCFTIGLEFSQTNLPECSHF